VPYIHTAPSAPLESRPRHSQLKLALAAGVRMLPWDWEAILASLGSSGQSGPELTKLAKLAQTG